MRVEAAMVEGLPWVAVSDTGCGVPPQDRDEDLPPLLSRRAQRAGHGLGLSIAQTIADLHGFQLTVEDNSPGARFVMRASAKAAARPGAGGRVIRRFRVRAPAGVFIQILFSGSARLPQASRSRSLASCQPGGWRHGLACPDIAVESWSRRRVKCSLSSVLL